MIISPCKLGVSSQALSREVGLVLRHPLERPRWLHVVGAGDGLSRLGHSPEDEVTAIGSGAIECSLKASCGEPQDNKRWWSH